MLKNKRRRRVQRPLRRKVPKALTAVIAVVFFLVFVGYVVLPQIPRIGFNFELDWPVVALLMAAAFVLLMPYFKKLKFGDVEAELADEAAIKVSQRSERALEKEDAASKLSLQEELEQIARQLQSYNLLQLERLGVILPGTARAVTGFTGTAGYVTRAFPGPLALSRMVHSGRRLQEFLKERSEAAQRMQMQGGGEPSPGGQPGPGSPQ